MNNNENNKNYGIMVLRMFACFIVICCHFFKIPFSNSHITNFIDFYKPVAVPIFMIISGYYSYKILKCPKRRLIEKLHKIYFPLLIWGIIYFVIYKIFRIETLSVKDLIYQITFGHSSKLNATMWYSFDLIIITLFSWIICKIFKKKSEYIFLLITFISFFMQYSGLNLKIFDRYIFEIKYPLGRIMEVIPMYNLGLILYKYRILEKIKNKLCYLTIIFCIATIILIKKYNLFIDINGFDYPGIKLVLISFLMFISFYIIPLEKLPLKVRKIIEFSTRYTMGIYCMHRLVSNLLLLKIKTLDFTLSYCFLIYFICYVICYFISLLPGKYFKKLVN